MGAVKKSGKATAAAAEVELICPAGDEKAEDAKKRTKLLKMLQTIARGGDINATDKNGQTALMYAAALNERLSVCWLVAKGADVTLTSKKGKTAQDLARTFMLRDLLDACEQDIKPTPQMKEYPMHVMSVPDQVRRFREMVQNARRGTLPSATECEKPGILPLEVSLYPESIAYIVRHGADINIHTPEGQLPLRRVKPTGIAIQHCEQDIIDGDTARLMVALGMKAQNNEEALCLALLCDRVDEVKRLLQQEPELIKTHAPGGFPLLALVQSGQAVELLLAAGADMNDLFAERKWEPGISYTLFDNAVDKDISVMKAYLDGLKAKGLSLPERKRLSFLHEAKTKEMTELLLKAGQDIEAQSWFKKAPLQWAAEHGYTEMLPALLAHGAKVPENIIPGIICQAKPRIDESPSDYAARVTALPDMLRALSAAGAPLTSEMWDALMERLDTPRWDSSATAADRKADVQLVSSLLTLGKEKGIELPEYILAHLPYTNALGARERTAIAKLLLEAGADPKVLGRYHKQTALFTASAADAELTQQLLRAGVDPKATARGGLTALHLARTAEVAGALIKAGVDVNAAIDSSIQGLPESPRTPLGYMIELADEQHLLPLVKTMLAAGATVHGTTEDERSWDVFELHFPQMSLDTFKEIAALLRKGGADINLGWLNPTIPTAYLLAAGADTAWKDPKGRTPATLRPDLNK